MEQNAKKSILKHHNLRITKCRLDVLDFFIGADHALSNPELEEKFAQYDRVTLYRTINSFVEQGVIHSIPDNSGFARYGICYNTCSPSDHSHNHAHFKCEDCGKIECIQDYNLPPIKIPKGYDLRGSELILNGICPRCNSG